MSNSHNAQGREPKSKYSKYALWETVKMLCFAVLYNSNKILYNK